MNVDLSTVDWHKSSRSGGESGDCVEIASVVRWRKSSRSGGSTGDCVEIGVVTSRDS
jgi:Domain of unknown function (DUF397)